MGTTFTTAATLRAILCFIDAKNTPKVAFDDDQYAIPMADKIKAALRDNDGSERVSITFHNDERELLRQFNGVCANIKGIFEFLVVITDPNKNV